MALEQLAARGSIDSGPSRLIAGALLLFAACGTVREQRMPSEPAVFVVEVAGIERFKIQLVDPKCIAEAKSLLESGGRASVVGVLRSGDGGFNAPYGWHLAPESIRFTRERNGLRDALPSEVEEGLEHWLQEDGLYCPWEGRLVARER